MLPEDVSTGATLAFIGHHLPRSETKLLDVGCGSGALAVRLAAQGVRVRGLDVDEEAIARSRERGVDAVQADFLDYEDEPFDVILFARSLHHIQPLSEAMARTKTLLKPSGVMLVDDFGVDLVNRRAVAWRYGVKALLATAGLLTESDDQHDFAHDPLDRWREEHLGEHPIADSVALRESLSKHFSIELEERAPYLYRYLVDRLEPTKRGAEVAQYLLAWEESLIQAGEIPPVGLRWVGRKSNSRASKNKEV